MMCFLEKFLKMKAALNNAGESNSPPSPDSRRVVSYKRKYVHEVLVNCLVKHAQENVSLGELTFQK